MKDIIQEEKLLYMMLSRAEKQSYKVPEVASFK